MPSTRLSDDSDIKLIAISVTRKQNNNLVNSKIGILAELINKEYKKTFKDGAKS